METMNISWMLVGVFLQGCSTTLLLATALSDPGIVPRQDSFTDRYDAKTRSFRLK